MDIGNLEIDRDYLLNIHSHFEIKLKEVGYSAGLHKGRTCRFNRVNLLSRIAFAAGDL